MIRACLGETGSGKSYQLQRLIASELEREGGWRFVVVDVTHAIRERNGLRPEWPDDPLKKHRSATVGGPWSAVKAAEDGHRLIIVRAPEDRRGERDPVWAPFVEDIAQSCVAIGRSILVVPEAHNVLREHHTITPTVKHILHEHRHLQVGVWLDSQHPSYVSNEALNACKWWYWFATGSETDRSRAARTHPRLREALIDVGRRATEGTGAVVCPGWHIRIPRTAPEHSAIVAPDGSIAGTVG